MSNKSLSIIVKELLELARDKQLNFALAVVYPDEDQHLWFQAHTAGNKELLETLFKMDSNAAAEAKLHLKDSSSDSNEMVYYSLPPKPISV